LAAAALTLPVRAARSESLQPIAVVLPLGFSITFFDAMNAHSGGHYARQGLQAKVIGANTGVQMAQLLVAGQAQFGRGSPPDQIRAVAAGQAAPISIATIGQGCAFRVFSHKDRPVLEPKDFKGKTVGLNTAASPTEVYLDVMLAQAGLARSDVQRQVSGGTPAAFEIMKQGRVDCFISTQAVEVALKRRGEPIIVWNPGRYLPLPGQTYLAMPDTLKATPDLAVRFLRAIHASAQEIIHGPTAPLLERAAKDFEIPGSADPEMQVAILKAIVEETWLSEGKENFLRNLPRLWDSGLAALRAAKIVDLKDARALYTDSFVDAALKT
jgi:ABC-type nitrate/sulfonate/bicarbonate transport system substrate-binding protein